MFNVLVVSLCKPVVHKLNILGGGNLNIINQWGTTKRGSQIAKSQSGGGGGKEGEHDF